MDGRMKKSGWWSKFAACMWKYTKAVLTTGQIHTPEMEEY